MTTIKKIKLSIEDRLPGINLGWKHANFIHINKEMTRYIMISHAGTIYLSRGNGYEEISVDEAVKMISTYYKFKNFE